MKIVNCKNVGYYPVPKVACTSIKNEFYRIENNKDFEQSKYGLHIHEYWNRTDTENENIDYIFTVVRDPIKRFLSAYSNRVIYHKELSESYISKMAPENIDIIDIFNPGLGQFIDDFDKYQQIPTIDHHCQPLSRLFSNVENIDYWFKLEDISQLESELTTKFNEPVKFKRVQTGGKKIPIQDLSVNQLDFLIEYYRRDYELLAGIYSLDSFWREWKRGI